MRPNKEPFVDRLGDIISEKAMKAAWVLRNAAMQDSAGYAAQLRAEGFTEAANYWEGLTEWK